MQTTEHSRIEQWYYKLPRAQKRAVLLCAVILLCGVGVGGYALARLAIGAIPEGVGILDVMTPVFFLGMAYYTFRGMVVSRRYTRQRAKECSCQRAAKQNGQQASTDRENDGNNPHPEED